MTARSEFLQPKTGMLRAWHWLNFLAISGLLLTAGLRKTVLSWHNVSAIIQDKLAALDITITPEAAKDIAVAIRDPMWDLHYVFGFTLAGLFFMRVLMSFIPNQPGPFHEFKGTFKSASTHKKLVKLGYAAFYLLVFYMVLSGMTMYFKTELGLEKSFISPLKDIHELLMWFFLSFSLLHIAGVVVAELRGEPLVSNMISNTSAKQDDTRQS